MDLLKINADTGEHVQFTNERIAQFLLQHLDQYGDALPDIKKCLDYVYEKGGFITVAHEGDDIKGAVVINETGMSGYIPENILVYIAVHESTRGKGVGKKLMQFAMEKANGDVALHVEPDNPARFLYEKLGFSNKYLEMRYKKS